MQYQKTIWKKGDRIKAKALNNLEDGVANNTACLNEFSQGFDCLSAALNALTDSTATLGEEVKNLSSNLSGDKNNEEIVTQVNALLEKVDTLEISYNALTAEISSLQEQDETALSKLADLSTRLGEMKTSLENKDTELEAKDNEIQGNVNTLKEEVTGSVSLLEKNVSDVHETSLINSMQLKALNELIRYKDSGQEIKFQEGQNAIISEQPVSLNNVAITTSKSVTAKAITLNGLEATSSFFEAKATNNIDMSQVVASGDLPKATSQAVLKLRNDGAVYLDKISLEGTSYNGIEIGLSSTVDSQTTDYAPKSIYVSDLNIADTSNNGISIFNYAENANITFVNCHFGKVSNCFRISNRSNVPATFTFINCSCDQWDTSEYRGMVCLQDYTSKTLEQTQETNRFAKLTLRFINCSGPDGKIISKPAEEVCGSKDENQLLYIYNNKEGFLAYDANRYPKVLYE